MKEKFNIEYDLSNVSLPILWSSIGTPLGLSEWFAEGVTNEDEEYVFSWENFEQNAVLLHSKQNSYIRFQWVEDEGTNAYFELKIEKPEISKDLTLIITDFAEPDEMEDAILLWNKQIDELKRKTGML